MTALRTTRDQAPRLANRHLGGRTAGLSFRDLVDVSMLIAVTSSTPASAGTVTRNCIEPVRLRHAGTNFDKQRTATQAPSAVVLNPTNSTTKETK